MAQLIFKPKVHFVYPQLPNRAYFGTPLFNQLDRDKKYVAEIKRNGWRMEAIKSDGGVLLYTRHAKIVIDYKNSKLHGIRDSLNAMMPDQSVLDGELLDRRSTPNNVKDVFYVFDVLWWNGNVVWNLPFWQRRELLESVIKPNQHIWLAEQFRVGRKFLYTQAIQQGDEGIVFKRLDSSYLIGHTDSKTNPTWIKIKKDEDHFVNKKGGQHG